MLAIVIPCYNETKRFPKEAFYKYISENANHNIHYYLVNDGSTDETASYLQEIANEYAHYHVYTLNFKINKGKAEAIRNAFNLLSENEIYEWYAYLDADFATHPKELVKMYEIALSRVGVKMAMGARWLRLGSEIVRDPKRHYFGRVFATVASYMLRLKVYDTQCGAKVLHKDFVDIIKNEPFISKWIFDVEILARIVQNKGVRLAEKSIIEIPLDKWEDVKGSKIKLKDLLVLPIELWNIKKKYSL